MKQSTTPSQNWTIAKLDAMDEERFDREMAPLADPNVQAVVVGLAERHLAEMRSEERAIAEADCGNMRPLRKLYPQLERFLQPPKLKRGQHLKPFGGQWDEEARVRCALADLPRIKAIWKANGFSYRRNTAIEIAAERWKVSVNAVRKRNPKKERGAVKTSAARAHQRLAARPHGRPRRGQRGAFRQKRTPPGGAQVSQGAVRGPPTD
jgi:hypothetical protein